jgi:hypothetical protein
MKWRRGFLRIQNSERARFTLNPDKEQGPSNQVTAFNIVLSSSSMLIESARLQGFC